MYKNEIDDLKFKIFKKGETFSAHLWIIDLLKSADESIVLIDNTAKDKYLIIDKNLVLKLDDSLHSFGESRDIGVYLLSDFSQEDILHFCNSKEKLERIES